ncbi:fimbrial protein [Enterobacter asburiae]|nr:fimbrial protein [Enterobacter asburiae]
MKKLAIAALMPALFVTAFSGHAAAPAVTVDGGKINFEGAVVAAPCAVDNTTNGQTVILGQVPTNSLAAKGNTSSAVPFTIGLTGCDLTVANPDETANETVSYTSASITFNGATVGDDSTLAIQPASNTSAAQNVGIQIFQNNKAVKVDGSTATDAQRILTGNNQIPFSAAYVATADGVVPGSANSTVNFQISYE